MKKKKTKQCLLYAKPYKKYSWWPKTNDGWVTVDPDSGWRADSVPTLTFPVHDLDIVKEQMIENVGKCRWRICYVDAHEKPPCGGKACPIR